MPDLDQDGMKSPAEALAYVLDKGMSPDEALAELEKYGFKLEAAAGGSEMPEVPEAPVDALDSAIAESAPEDEGDADPYAGLSLDDARGKALDTAYDKLDKKSKKKGDQEMPDAA